MKNIYIGIVGFMVLWYGIGIPNARADTPSITVLSPNGGEQWEIGKTYQIKWSAPLLNLVNILLYKGNNCSLNSVTSKQVCGNVVNFSQTPPTALAVNMPNTGLYSWIVPSFLTTGEDYRIAIQNPDNLPFIDQSDASFSIIAPTSTRDIKRVSDIQNLRTVLILYYTDKGSYPVSLSSPVPTYMPEVPVDPLGNMYFYQSLPNGCTGDGNNPCVNYHVGANLEMSASRFLLNDADEETNAGGLGA